MLERLLSNLEQQRTEGLFDLSIVIVDNDRSGSARQTVEAFARESKISLHYEVEPVQNIARARNRTVALARGDFAAFIDDDESPVEEWLLRMYRTLLSYGADGVFGPVLPQYATAPPQWMIKADLFERPRYETTGSVINWKQTGMGNVLVRRKILEELAGPFNEAFGSGGEDVDFFRRAEELGKVLVWCGEATVYETVPPDRMRLSFQLRRALLRGKATQSHPIGRATGILKSLSAFGLYTLLLPLLLLRGRHLFVKYLVKDFDHIGKLLAACGIDVIKEKYILK